MNAADQKQNDDKGKPNDDLTLTIISPRGTRDFTFDKNTKVQVVIEEARTAFGFAPGVFVLRRESTGETMAPDRPLVSYHLKPNEIFKLAPEQGSGV